MKSLPKTLSQFSSSILRCAVILFIFLSIYSKVSYSSCDRVTHQVKKNEVLSKIVFYQKRKLSIKGELYGSEGFLALTLKENPKIKRHGDFLLPGLIITFPLELSVSGDDLPACSESGSSLQSRSTPVSSRKPAAETTGDNSPKDDSPKEEAVSAEAPASSAPEVAVPSQEAPGVQIKHDSEKVEPSRPLVSESTLDFGLGLMLSDSAASLSFPQFFVRSKIVLSEEIDLLPMIDGFLPTYIGATGSSYEGQIRLAAGYKLMEQHLTLGLGLRYFSFGYSSPSLGAITGATSLDGVLLVGYQTKFEECYVLEAMADFRIPFSISGNSGDAVSSSIQFGGLGLLLKGGYQIDPVFSLGPYVYVNSITLNWSQSAGAGSWSALEISSGAYLTLRF